MFCDLFLIYNEGHKNRSIACIIIYSFSLWKIFLDKSARYLFPYQSFSHPFAPVFSLCYVECFNVNHIILSLLLRVPYVLEYFDVYNKIFSNPIDSILKLLP